MPFFNISSDTFWRRQWQPTPVLLPGKPHGWRSLVGCSPWGHDTTEQLHFHFDALEKEMATHSSVLACLENPRDGGAWWAAIYGVGQSRTRLKQLSSSSSSSYQVAELEDWVECISGKHFSFNKYLGNYHEPSRELADWTQDENEKNMYSPKGSYCPVEK